MTEFVGSKSDVLPAVMHLELIREAMRTELQMGVAADRRHTLILETRAIKMRQVMMVEQLFERKNGAI